MEDDESYSSAMSRILENARGPLEDIEDFDTGEPDSPDPKTEISAAPAKPLSIDSTPAADNLAAAKSTPSATAPVTKSTSLTTDRLAILQLAAMMAVLGMSDEAPAKTGQIGRRRGTAWAQDHRFAAMGLPGVAHRMTQRSTWR